MNTTTQKANWLQTLFTPVARIMSNLQSENIPFSCHVLTFLFAVTLRSLVEATSTKLPLAVIPAAWTHYYLWAMSLAAAIIALGHFVTRESPMRTARLVLPGFILLLIAPTIDLLVTSGGGAAMNYICPGDPVPLYQRFATFFGPPMKSGITLGMRIEIAIVLCFALLLFHLKRCGLMRSFIGAFCLYIVIFGFVSVPCFTDPVLRSISPGYRYSSSDIDYCFVLTTILLLVFLLWRERPTLFAALARNMRIPRLLHYELMLAFGWALTGVHITRPLAASKILEALMLGVSVAAAWCFAVATNDLADEAIDRVSSPSRPLVNNTILRTEHNHVTWVFFVIACVSAFVLHPIPFFLILCFMASYYVYSVPPLRLKRIPIMSKLVISGNSLLLVAVGFMLGGRELYHLPSKLVLFFLVPVTLAANFIDLKDYEGDRKEGVWTLPVLIGMRPAQFIIGAFWLVAYASFAMLTPAHWLRVVLLIIGVIQFALITRRRYSELPVFCVYLASLLAVLFLLFSKAQVLIAEGHACSKSSHGICRLLTSSTGRACYNTSIEERREPCRPPLSSMS